MYSFLATIHLHLGIKLTRSRPIAHWQSWTRK